MPSEVVATPAANPANAPGNVVLDRPARGVVAAQRARAGRSETLALLEAGKLDGAKPSVPAGRAAAPAGDPEQQPGGTRRAAPVEEPEEPIEAGADEGTEDEGDGEVEAPPAAKPDPETSKRLGQIQAAEARHRQKIAADQAKIDARVRALETEWAPKIKAASDFEALQAKAARARANPAHLGDLLKSLGYGEDHFEGAGQALYALSKAGQADPARAKQAERLLRDREESERVDATQRRLEELEKKFTVREQQTEYQELKTGYLDAVLEAVPDTAPITKSALAKIEQARAAARAAKTSEERVQALAKAKQLNTKLRGKLWELTEAMAKEEGEYPDLADVIARHEQIRGEELDELDIPRPTAKSDKKPNNQIADKQNPAKTLSADLGAPRVPRTTTSGKEHRAETRKMLESGKFE
jgi:hypothetical protein